MDIESSQITMDNILDIAIIQKHKNINRDIFAPLAQIAMNDKDEMMRENATLMLRSYITGIVDIQWEN